MPTPSALAVISKSEFAKMRGHDGALPAPGVKIPIMRWDDTHPALDVLAKHGVLYLVTERQNNGVWLVGVLGASKKDKKGWAARVQNTVPIVDITAIREPLGFTRLGTTARLLDERQAAILDYVRGNAVSAKQYVPDHLPDRFLTPQAEPVPAKAARPKLPKLAGELGEACLDSIEDVIDELRAKPDKFLSRRGAFVTDVQSIYEGAVDAKQAQKMLQGELAPFAGRDRDLDKVAKRAIDELCRGMVALALGREADVPASCESLRKPLARYAAVVKTMLAS